ncbi:hypothetical protein HRbin19_01154 [bacterium HR19]|nr:hypothetical protein HRbin19_01154 [bacterium HR19]
MWLRKNTSFYSLQKGILLLFTLTFAISLIQCAKEKKEDDFSTGLANRDPKISEGITYIEKEKIQEAKKFFRELGKENPKHCGYLIGYPLVSIQEYLSKIAAIINFAVSVYGTGGGASPSILPKQAEINPKAGCDDALDRMIREFAKSLHNETEDGLALIEKAISQQCEMELEYPLSISIGNSFKIRLILYGKFGSAEMSLLRYIGYLTLSISSAILSHDYSVDTLTILQNISKIEGRNITSLLRTLAFIMVGCDRTLAFHPEDKSYLSKITSYVVKSIESGFSFLQELERRNGKEGYVLYFKDNSGEGKIGYNPDTVTIATPRDEIAIQVKGEIQAGTIKLNMTKITIEVPYIISFDFIDEAKEIANKIKRILEEGKGGCPENCISIADANFFLKALNTAKIDDFVRIDIVKFIKEPKPIREILPYWFFNSTLKRWEFMLESEVHPSRQDTSYFIFNYDSPHFNFPDVITFMGREIKNFSIPPDCVFLDQNSPDWLLIPYLLLQDPTLGGSIYMRLKGTFIERCSGREDPFMTDEWKPADDYMINKMIAIITKKTGSIIIPLVDIISKSVKLE